MRFTDFSSFSALALSALSIVSGTRVPIKRQVIPSHGTTVAPADGAVLQPGDAFAFNYENSNTCESGYSPISVYLSESAPTDADIVNGSLTTGSFIFKFGNWLIPNFGLPPMSNPPPPPSTLTMPTLSVSDGDTLFFSVVETFLSCPPDGHTSYGLETTTVVYA